MERLGLGADELRQRHPRLIYVSISGVGDTGPYVKKRVYDPIIQGLSGFADIQSQPVTNRPQMIRTIVCDKTTAIFTAQAVSSALYAREKDRAGRSYPCRDAGCHDFVSVAGRHDAIHRRRRRGHGCRSQRPAGPRVQDQRWLHHGGHHFRFRMAGFLPGVGRSRSLPRIARFATPSARSVNATARINKMAEYIAQHTTAEWLERLDAADVPCAPILRRGEIIHNEQVVARGIIAEFDQPMVGRVRQPKPAAQFEINKAAIGGPAPRVGEHYARGAARSRLRRRRYRQDGQRKIDPGSGLKHDPERRLTGFPATNGAEIMR